MRSVHCESLLGRSDGAESAGVNRSDFELPVTAPTTRQILVHSKKEGIVNKVDATLTYFINDKKNMAEIDAEELKDVLEEECERINGR